MKIAIILKYRIEEMFWYIKPCTRSWWRAKKASKNTRLFCCWN